MAWIESHQELGRHPKTRKAARRLSIPVPQMMGHLHLLWHWALDYADTGDLTDHDDEDIALGAMWEGEPDEFVQVLTDVGFIDPDRTLHDWMDYAGRLVRDRIRKREERATVNGTPSDAVHGQSTDSPTTDESESTDRARARTLPNPTQPTEPESEARKRAERATRLPDGWQPDPEPELVKAIGGQRAAKEQFDRFCDHWRGQPGAKGRKVDWQATWRNWLRRAPEFSGGKLQVAKGSPETEQSKVYGTPEYEARQAVERAQREALVGGA